MTVMQVPSTFPHAERDQPAAPKRSEPKRFIYRDWSTMNLAQGEKEMSVRPWIYHDGRLELRGEIHEPRGRANGCAVLVVHEADGLGQNVRRRCEMLAALGYVAGAADMHGGGRILGEGEMMPAVVRFREDADLIRGRVGAAFDALRTASGAPAAATAAIGYCFGGYAVLELARAGVSAAAVASFHGLLTTARPASRGEVRAPVLVTTGMMDPLVPDEDVERFEQEMRAAEADWHLLKHGRAYHSFSNARVDQLGDSRMRYDATADAVSWAAATAFLAASMPKEGEA